MKRTIEEQRAVLGRAQQTSDRVAVADLITELSEVDSAESRALMLRARGYLHFLDTDYEEAFACYNAAYAECQASGNQEQILAVSNEIGTVFFSMGKVQEALPYLQRAVDLSELLGAVRNMGGMMNNLALVYQRMGDFPAALEVLRNALELAERHGQATHVANIIANLGLVHLSMNDDGAGLAFLERAEALQLDLNNPYDAAGITCNLATALDRLGRTDEAAAKLREGIQQAAAQGFKRHQIDMVFTLISILARQKKYQEARSIGDTYADLLNATEYGRCSVDSVYARMLFEQGQYEEAERRAIGVLEYSQQQGQRTLTMDAHEVLRDIARSRGDMDAYIDQSEKYQRLKDDMHGAEAAKRFALQLAQQEIAAERQEREKERALLYGALPEHIATRMLRGETIEDHFENAAVLFADIAGFTTHTSGMHPSDTVKLLEDLYQHFDAICAEHGVVKVKTIGDSYLCFAHEGNGESGMGNGAAERVAAVALAMQNAEFYWPTSHELRATSSNSNRIQLRIGIHSGPVSAGVIGTQRLQYDIWGDTVNVASRMESTGEAGRIQVSSPFATALGNGELVMGNAAKARVIPSEGEEPHSPFPIPYSLRERGTVEVKGKGQMQTYWLEGA